MLFGKKKKKIAEEAALRRTMDAILAGLSAEEIALSPDGRRLRAILRRSPFLCLELETPIPTGIRLARVLSPTKEEVFSLSSGATAERDRLRAILQQYLSIESDVVSPAAGERTYRLKVSVLGDFTYLPKWEELGHADVKIGGETDGEN